MLKKVLITTGGTAGHIYPAVAVIEELQKKYPSIEILFVGACVGQEESIIKKYAIPFIGLPVQGIMGKKLQAIKSIFLLIKSIYKAIGICRSFKPDVIIGFGGYACFPSIFAGKLLSIPTVLHEQNIISGFSNKILSYIVNTICVSFPETSSSFAGKNVVLTGNPQRAILRASKEKLSTPPNKNLLILGGSLGAVAINSYIIKIAKTLLEQNISIWHQTGKKDFTRVETLYKELGVLDSIKVSSFIDTMEEAYAWADFAICRSGAGTIVELQCMAIPAIFIPFPAAVNNHQWHNAQAQIKDNANLCFTEAELTEKILLDAVAELSNPKNLIDMRNKVYKKAQWNSAEMIIAELEKFCKK